VVLIGGQAEDALEIASHTLILSITLISLWLVHFLLQGFLGQDAKFFNFIPN
jgi:hypothetical protein